MMVPVSLTRRLVSEFLGSAFLLMAIVGSGIAAERLSGGNQALELMANISAISAALVAIILTLAEISGPHLNPVVTLCDALMRSLTGGRYGGLRWGHTVPYIAAQVAGAQLGVVLSHAMFGLPLVMHSARVRSGPAQWLGEAIATFGLLAVIWGCVMGKHRDRVAYAIAAFIFAACWFTSSTSFANPAVTLARSFTATYTGIRGADVLPFALAQLAGGFAATALFARAKR